MRDKIQPIELKEIFKQIYDSTDTWEPIDEELHTTFDMVPNYAILMTTNELPNGNVSIPNINEIERNYTGFVEVSTKNGFEDECFEYLFNGGTQYMHWNQIDHDPEMVGRKNTWLANHFKIEEAYQPFFGGLSFKRTGTFALEERLELVVEQTENDLELGIYAGAEGTSNPAIIKTNIKLYNSDGSATEQFQRMRQNPTLFRDKIDFLNLFGGLGVSKDSTIFRDSGFEEKFRRLYGSKSIDGANLSSILGLIEPGNIDNYENFGHLYL